MNLAIITGTTRGLGRALAEKFRSENWTVLELNRPHFDLARAGELAPAIMARATQFAADRVVLIDNAAGLHIEPAVDQSLDTIRDDLTINLIGPIQLMAAFLKAFPTGEIVNVTSGAVNTDFHGWSLYAVAKAGLARHIKALAAEGHKASCFYPGVFDTDMQKAIRGSKFNGVEGFIELKNSGKLKAPEEVASLLFQQVMA